MTHTLELERRRGDDSQVAATLRRLSEANRLLQLRTEGRRQLEEALEIVERIGDTIEQAECLNFLAFQLIEDREADAAEKAASRAIDLLPEKGQEYLVCNLNQVLGMINRSKGKREKALHHYETGLRIASPCNWHHILFWIHYALAQLFGDGRELDDESAHIEQAKSYAVDGAMQYALGRATKMQAEAWYRELRFEDAKSEALDAIQIYEKLGLAEDVNSCHYILQQIERATNRWSTRPPGELLEMMLHLTPVDLRFLAAKYTTQHLGKYRSRR
jgi:ATP/maltotriose-dependent transcriptional regulator MalT